MMEGPGFLMFSLQTCYICNTRTSSLLIQVRVHDTWYCNRYFIGNIGREAQLYKRPRCLIHPLFRSPSSARTLSKYSLKSLIHLQFKPLHSMLKAHIPYLLNPNINDTSSFTISTKFPSACAFAPGLPDNAADAYIHELQLLGILLALMTDWDSE